MGSVAPRGNGTRARERPAMNGVANGVGPMRELLIVALDDDRVAFAVEDVREVHRAALPTRLPNAPDIVEGILNVRGELIPVLNVRRRLGHADRPLRASDHLVVARANGRLAAFPVDQVVELTRLAPSDILAASSIVTGTTHVAGVAMLADGVIVIHDLVAFLSANELFALDAAIDGAVPA